MAFEQVLDAAIDLLRRRQRVTYRLLQREFGLDDEAFADLKHELIRGQRVARDDEEGGVLVWREAHTVAVAERRQLTVMFCDLVGSTRLSATLDPEDLRELVHQYQVACESALAPLGGHIAQYLGDGILAYFGYPQAHEDDPQRAVRAGLGVVQAVRRLKAPLVERFGVELAVRVGIHTGLVVIGDMGGAERRETLALGEAPNLAAHIQARAEPDSVLVSEDTYRLLGGRFVGEPHSEQPLKDSSRSLRLLRIASESEAPARERPHGRALIDVDGHAQSLRAAWEDACAGAGRAVGLFGEAGLGKTRLVDELRAAVRSAAGEAMVLRCSAFHRHSALHPFAEQIARRAGLEADSPSDEVSERLKALLQTADIGRPDALALMAALVAPGSASAVAAAGMPPAQLAQATQALLVDWLASAARRGPLLLVCEDLHWADASTLALLKHLMDKPCSAQMMVLLTSRPDAELPWPPEALSQRLELQRLPPDSVAQLVRQLAGPRPLAEALVERIVQAADGVPLYAEEITKAVLEAPGEPSDAAAIEVPATLQASLMARLDRLGDTKQLAQSASLLGREFSFELLAAVVDLPAAELGSALHRLVSADLLRRRGTPPQARYTFRHALVQAAASDSLLRSQRTQLHRRIADALQARFGALVEAEPQTLAHHLTEAGESLRAIPMWQRAGERALSRSALVEATAHLEAGLALLDAAGAGPQRERLELDLQVMRASALRAVKGIAAPPTGEAYERAVLLARGLDDPHSLIPALNGLYSYHMVRGQCEAAYAPARELLAVAEARGDAMYRMIGHRALGAVAFHVGEPLVARDHLHSAIAAYDVKRHAQLAVMLGVDHKVTTSNFLSLTLFVLGEPEAAMEVQRAGLAHAEALDHAHSKAQALVFGCVLLALREDWAELARWATRVIQIGRERAFPLMEGGGHFFVGAAQAFGDGHLDAGMATMQKGTDQWWSTGARNYRSYVQMLMAIAQARRGHAEAARRLLQAAHQEIAATGERWSEAELLRVEAGLLRQAEGEAAAQARLQQALSLARRQGAVVWERRAAQDLQQAAGASTP